MTSWDTYTNTDLLAVDPATLSSDDLQTYRETMLARRLSTITPPVVPEVLLPARPTTQSLVSAGGYAYTLAVADDGSLMTNRLHVQIPDGIADGQVNAYDASAGRMVPVTLATGPAPPGDALTEDTGSGVPLTDEAGDWLTADTLPDWLVADSTSETLTNEAGSLALRQG